MLPWAARHIGEFILQNIQQLAIRYVDMGRSFQHRRLQGNDSQTSRHLGFLFQILRVGRSGQLRNLLAIIGGFPADRDGGASA